VLAATVDAVAGFPATVIGFVPVLALDVIGIVGRLVTVGTCVVVLVVLDTTVVVRVLADIVLLVGKGKMGLLWTLPPSPAERQLGGAKPTSQ
jgi:hypothetical protein